MTPAMPATPAETAFSQAESRRIVPLAMSLFFAFGFCTVLVDTLTPKLKGLFELNYVEVMLTPFVFFGAYFLMSLPAAWMLRRFGYLQSVIIGLVLTALGCALFTPAANLGVYEAFMGATFVMATGVTIVQVAANPLTTIVGDPSYSHSRLTLAQAFNSLATTVGPIFGAYFILSKSKDLPAASSVAPEMLATLRQEAAQSVQGPFLGIAIALIALAIFCLFFIKNSPKAGAEGGSYRSLLGNRRLIFGMVSIFVYVGAEVAIGGLMTNYLMSAHTISAPIAVAGSMVSVYWGLAMVGRFIGFVVLRRVNPGLVLSLCAVGAGVLATISGLSGGYVAVASILAIGLCNSIMFPTIFTLAIEGLGDSTPKGSGLLCLAIVGGALVPLLSGWVADTAGLTAFLIVPVVCYLWIAFYGRFASKAAA